MAAEMTMIFTKERETLLAATPDPSGCKGDFSVLKLRLENTAVRDSRLQSDAQKRAVKLSIDDVMKFCIPCAVA